MATDGDCVVALDRTGWFSELAACEVASPSELDFALRSVERCRTPGGEALDRMTWSSSWRWETAYFDVTDGSLVAHAYSDDSLYCPCAVVWSGRAVPDCAVEFAWTCP